MNNKIIKEKIGFILDDFKKKKFNDAILKSKRLLEKIPNNDFLLNAIGMCYLGLEDYEKSSFFFLDAIKKNPENLTAKNNYALVLKALNKFNESEILLEAILAKDPNNKVALNNIANIKKDNREFQEAIKYLNKILERDKNNITVHHNLSLCYQDLRNYKKATEHAQRINKINPNYTAADKILSSLYNYKNEGKDHLNQMIDKTKKLKLSPDEKISLHFSLGKAYEDLENYEEAFKNYKLANENGIIVKPYDIEKDEKNLDKIKKIFNNKKIFNQNFKQKSSKQIIFICGMPRSGSTLLEQIISTHSKVGNMGETDYFRKTFEVFFDLDNENSFDKIHDYSKKHSNVIFEDYLKRTENLKLKENIFTDKSLLNFKYIGFIKIIFPNSKIIITSRNFKNNLLSIYKNNLPQVRWTYNIEQIKQFNSIFLRYVDFWKDKFGDELINIEYEDLVKNTEDVSKKIIKFCDLEWEPNLLDYHKKNTAPIKTASVNQADKPVYKKSLDKFTKFEKFFNL